jgi:hypothetical protein
MTAPEISDAPLTSAQRVARYRKARKAAGLVRPDIWVPIERLDEIKQIASQMVDGIKPCTNNTIREGLCNDY